MGQRIGAVVITDSQLLKTGFSSAGTIQNGPVVQNFKELTDRDRNSSNSRPAQSFLS